MSPEPTQELPGEIPIVLLIAPRSDARDRYDSALRRGGLWTELASSPEDGLGAARELRPDAIVTESTEPGPAGLAALARTLRSDESTRHIPRVALAPGHVTTVPRVRIADAQHDRAAADIVVHVRSVIARAAVLRARVRRLRERSSAIRQRSQQVLGRSASAVERAHRFRSCPGCGQLLRYSETRALHGVTFDYFRPCPTGCGLFGYDRAQRRVVTIIG